MSLDALIECKEVNTMDTSVVWDYGRIKTFIKHKLFSSIIIIFTIAIVALSIGIAPMYTTLDSHPAKRLALYTNSPVIFGYRGLGGAIYFNFIKSSVFSDNTTNDPTIYQPTAANSVAINTTSQVSNSTGGSSATQNTPPSTPQAKFSVASIAANPAQTSPGGTVTISAVIANTGNAGGSYAATLKINGTVDQSKQISVAAGATQVVNFPVSRSNAGSYSVDINGKTTAFTVSSPQAAVPAAPKPSNNPAKMEITSIQIMPEMAVVGEKVTVEASVKNSGGSNGSYNAVLKIIGETAQPKRTIVSLSPGESEVISFEVTKNSPGQYLVDINGKQATVTFTKPGILDDKLFWLTAGASLVLLALLIFLVMVIRRRSQYI
jgi:hypothetical protein